MKKVYFLAGFVFLAIVTTWGIGSYLAPDSLERCSKSPDPSKPSCYASDAIVAISGGDTAARTNEAIRLYQDGWGKQLIFSGAAQDKSGPSNAEVMRDIAIAAGVPRNDIITEELGETTKQNAENTNDIMDANDIKSVIVVTSGYHERRAMLEFQKRASSIEVRGHPVPRDEQWSPTWWLTPNSWYLAISELVKIAIHYTGVSS